VPEIQIRYVLLDVDDTLYPPATGMLQLLDARIEAYLEQRFGLSKTEAAQLRTTYWRKYGTTLGGLLAEHRVEPAEYLAFIHDVPVDTLLHPDPALDRLLARMRAEPVIFSNAAEAHVRRVLQRLGIAHRFRRLFYVENLDYVTKPRPEAFQRVLAALPADPAACLLVEDSPANVQAAQAAGMHTVQVGMPFDPHSGIHSHADYQIGDIHALEQVLAELDLLAPSPEI